MNRRTLFSALAAAAKDQGLKLLAKHGRPLGDKLAARLSKAGVERGLLTEPLDMNALLQRIKELRASGALNAEDARRLGKQIKDHFLQRFSKR